MQGLYSTLVIVVVIVVVCSSCWCSYQVMMETMYNTKKK